jgi:hypothetical protein
LEASSIIDIGPVRHKYQHADNVLIVNNRDPNLKPIDIPLPAPPPDKLIDGYGLSAAEQKFKRVKIPVALVKIIKACDTVDQIWDRIYAHHAELAEEIEWIKKQWYHRVHGYWFFNNGRPTWITGQHYFYLNYNQIDTGFPKYRDRSRKHFICMWFLETYTYDFKDKTYDKNNVRVPNKYGDELEDVGYRTIFGIVYPKMRRAGASYESLCWVLERITRFIRKHSGIQGPDRTHGHRAFKKLVSAWRKLPFFFQPIYEGDNDPEAKLNFVNKTSDDVNAELGLESIVTYATTSNALHYDQEKLLDYLREEPGKTVGSDVYHSWDQIKQTLAQGDGSEIVGFSLFPSTVGEMERAGGENFFYIVRDSDYYNRLKSGQTKTGMVTIFFPADEGLEGYIDEYGMSVTDTPTAEQAKFINKKHGAREHLLGQREHYLQLNTPESIEKYREHQRLYPLSLRECFTSMSGGVGFNELILDKRIAELRFDNDITIRGNFDWSDGFGSRVVFNENPKGRWVVSELLPDELSNQRYFQDGTYHPVNPGGYMHCSDPFNFDETEGKRQSNGGGIAIKRRKPGESDMDIRKWRTPAVSCTYSYRHGDTELYCEDMLMQNLYYGGKMNPEVNNEIVRKFYIKKGYRPFLFFYREEDGKYRKTAGYSLTGEMGNKILGSAVNFIEKHGHRCDHLELLQQCKDIKGKKDITNCDLVAVFSGACHGIENDYRTEEETVEEGTEWDLSSWVRRT